MTSNNRGRPLAHVMEFDRWQHHGVCAQMYATHPEYSDELDKIFYGSMGRPRKDPTQVKFCQACPVNQLCLEDAIAHDEEYGVWGGLSYAQRKALYRTMRTGLMIQALEGGWLDLTRLSPKDRRWAQDRVKAQKAEALRQAQKKTLEQTLQSLASEQPPEFLWHKRSEPELTEAV